MKTVTPIKDANEVAALYSLKRRKIGSTALTFVLIKMATKLALQTRILEEILL